MTKRTETLTTGEAAKWCGVSFRTVIRWIQRGELQAYQLPGRGDNRIRVDDFVAFLGKNGMPVPDELGGARAPRVLVVDDEPAAARFLAAALDGRGYEIEIVHDGFAAGNRLARLHPDLITVDLEMPGLGGVDVIRFIRSMPEHAHVKILVVSGQGAQQLQEALNAGADRALAKPTTLAEVRDAAAELIGVTKGERT